VDLSCYDTFLGSGGSSIQDALIFFNPTLIFMVSLHTQKSTHKPWPIATIIDGIEVGIGNGSGSGKGKD
jgi:hypothetical protein